MSVISESGMLMNGNAPSTIPCRRSPAVLRCLVEKTRDKPMTRAWTVAVRPPFLDYDPLSCALSPVTLENPTAVGAFVISTLTLCHAISSNAPFGSCWTWITCGGLLWVELLSSRTRYTGGTPRFHSTMSQDRRIRRSSTVRSIPTLDGSFSAQSMHGNVGRCRPYAIFAGC